MNTRDILPSLLHVREHGGDLRRALLEITPYAHTIHIDVMDGAFVPQKAFTPEEANAMSTRLRKEVHLMVRAPEKWIGKFRNTSLYYVHAELPRLDAAITMLRRKRYGVGIAINSSTPLRALAPHVASVDAILVMGVHPGKSGQKMKRSTIRRVRAVRAMNKKVRIVVDGGVTLKNMRALRDAGATQLVVASALFGHSSIPDFYRKAKEVLTC